MRKVVDYLLVTYHTTREVEDAVEDLLERRWELYGPCAISISSNNGREYCQTMVMYDEED